MKFFSNVLAADQMLDICYAGLFVYQRGKMSKKRNRVPGFYYDYILDLHGYNVDDAIFEIEKLMYSHVDSSIMIIHGRGTGILKKEIRSFLTSNNYIRDMHLGEELNVPGMDGITVIYT